MYANILGYNFESSGSVIKLADGKRELTSSEISELQSTPSYGSKYCSNLKLDGTEVVWDECDATRRYLCEYKGRFLELQKTNIF